MTRLIYEGPQPRSKKNLAKKPPIGNVAYRWGRGFTGHTRKLKTNALPPRGAVGCRHLGKFKAGVPTSHAANSAKKICKCQLFFF